MQFFEEIAIKQDGGFCSITIVLGVLRQNSTADFEIIIKNFMEKSHFTNIKILKTQIKKFSRAKLLQIGFDSCCPNKTEDLVFICDIDILFNQYFLEICRKNSIRAERVFFPILFSFYNPLIVEKFNQDKKIINNQLFINKDSGYFRDSGFGMACMHKQDFDKIGGFKDWFSSEWGGEDLHLYRKFLRSNIQIFRSITPGLIHKYHPKQCDPSKLSSIQYRDCLSIKILNEASHKNFGLMFLNYSLNKI